MSRLTKYSASCFSVLLGLFLCLPAYSASDKQLQSELQAIEQAALALQADINTLERDILFPPQLRIDLYLSVSMDKKQQKALSVRQVVVEVDAVKAVDYRYQSEQSKALLQGHQQLLWQGNLALGEHQIDVSYQLEDKRGRQVLGEKRFSFTKTNTLQPLLLHFSYEGESPSVSLTPIRQ